MDFVGFQVFEYQFRHIGVERACQDALPRFDNMGLYLILHESLGDLDTDGASADDDRSLGSVFDPFTDVSGVIQVAQGRHAFQVDARSGAHCQRSKRSASARKSRRGGSSCTGKRASTTTRLLPLGKRSSVSSSW